MINFFKSFFNKQKVTLLIDQNDNSLRKTEIIIKNYIKSHIFKDSEAYIPLSSLPYPIEEIKTAIKFELFLIESFKIYDPEKISNEYMKIKLIH